MVSPVAAMVSTSPATVASAQSSETGAPQVPSNNSTMASYVPRPVTSTLWSAAVATKLNQASFATLLVNVLQVMAGSDCVAPSVVPAVGTQVAEGVSSTALAQSSFAGGVAQAVADTSMV